MDASALNIFEYDNYRQFLKDYYEHRKKQDPSFSFRFFTKEAGFRAPNILKVVMDGERNLSTSGIEKFAKALNLKKQEAKFFKTLVFFNQAKTPEGKEPYAKEILSSRLYRQVKPLAKHQYEFWSGWYNVVVRNLVNFNSFQENPEWICDHVIPKIPAKTAQRSLKKLLKLKMIKRNEKGTLELADANITTGDQVIFMSIRRFHQQMIERGKESLDRFPKEERQVSSLTLSINQEKMEKIKVMINQFRKDLVAFANEGNHSDRIYQMNFQFFPVAKNLNPKEEDN